MLVQAMATEIAEGVQSVRTLNDGIAMPLFGLGVWQLTGNEVVDCIKIAFKHGYRLIDTASYYGLVCLFRLTFVILK